MIGAIKPEDRSSYIGQELVQDGQAWYIFKIREDVAILKRAGARFLLYELPIEHLTLK